IGVMVDPGPTEHLKRVQEALTTRRQVSLEYQSASRGELTERTVDPWGLIAAMGHWYLVGLDHLSDEERMFRLDRVKSVQLETAAASVPDDFDPERYKGAFSGDGGQPQITFEISPAAARWFEDYYPVVSAETLADGWRRITLVAGGTGWTSTLLLRLGAEVRNVDPEEAAAAARVLGDRIAARHAS
ncbi:MAG: WYL domain-containing protein, partial [Actinomycetota bacterium]|nr:WYL domain-containing protein [Actinomycetota bacterium]